MRQNSLRFAPKLTQVQTGKTCGRAIEARDGKTPDVSCAREGALEDAEAEGAPETEGAAAGALGRWKARQRPLKQKARQRLLQSGY